MSSQSTFTVTDDTQINKFELSLFVQADHSYSRPVISDIKEEECKIEDDLKVVEITEEVDVSMHFGENGTSYLQDMNGVQWNLENLDSFRLDELSWKPLGDIAKTEPEDAPINSVTLVKNCVKCKAFLSSGALCVKCNQPWVALTDIYKTKDSDKEKKTTIKDSKMGNESDVKLKKFYVIKKSDVETFINKNMGKLSVINQYVPGNVTNLNLNVAINDVSGQSDSNRTCVTNETNTTKQNISEQKKHVISERNSVSGTKSSNLIQVNTSDQNISKTVVNETGETSTVKQIDIEQRIDDIIENNEEKLNAKRKYMEVGTSKQSILKKIAAETGKVVKKRFPQQKEFESKFSFIQKLMAVNIDPLKQNKSFKKKAEKHKVDAGEKNTEKIKIKQNEVTEKDHVQKMNVTKTYANRKNVLSNKFLAVVVDPLKQNNPPKKEAGKQKVDAGEKSMEQTKIEQSEVTEKDDVQKMSVTKTYANTKSVLSHKFLALVIDPLNQNNLPEKEAEKQKVDAGEKRMEQIKIKENYVTEKDQVQKMSVTKTYANTKSVLSHKFLALVINPLNQNNLPKKEAVKQEVGAEEKNMEQIKSKENDVTEKDQVQKSIKKPYGKRKSALKQKFLTVDIDPLKQNNSSKKEVEKQKVDAGEKSMEQIKIKENDVTEKDQVQKSIKKPYGKRKSVLNHKFLNKKNKGNEEDTDSEEEKIVTENYKSGVKIKPKWRLTKRFLCVACDATFYKYNDLYKHMDKHNPPFGCTKCKTKLLSETQLKAHSVVHNVLTTREFKCRLCKKEVKNLNTLRTHSYTHVKNKEFPCSECDLSFYSEAQLKYHMVKHGALPYSCKLCHRQFKRCGYLTRHYCPKRWNPAENKNSLTSS